MQICYLYIRFFALFCLSALAAHAFQFSSAKVMVAKGTAVYGAPGKESTPITKDIILSEGDSIVTEDSGVVYLIFSNGVGLTIEANSNVVLTKLEQKPYWRNEDDAIPEEEISKSTFALDLKYGSIKGSVKGLREDSEFRIKTFLGDAVVSGNLFFVELLYDPLAQMYTLNVQNVNGIADLITKFSGSMRFKGKGIAKKSYNPEESVFQIVRIPPKYTVSMRASRSTLGLRDYYKIFPKKNKSRLVDEFQTIEPFIVDQEVTVVSPNGSEGIKNPETNMEEEEMPETVMNSNTPESAKEETVSEPVMEDIIPKTVMEETGPEETRAGIMSEETREGIVPEETESDLK